MNAVLRKERMLYVPFANRVYHYQMYTQQWIQNYAPKTMALDGWSAAKTIGSALSLQ